jgi:uncharacterized membrane protein YphA (DoxX/SURF4 family)
VLLSVFLYADGKRERHTVLFVFRLVLSSVYFWSGLQKLNVHFAVEMFPWLSEFTGCRNYVEAHHWTAYAVAGLEAAAGIGLWAGPLRKTAAVIILGTHLFILLSLGPTGHNWNSVVWPWNIAFAIMVYWSFIRESGPGGDAFAPGLKKKAGIAVTAALVTFLPVLNLFGCWDHFLSGSYYSSIVSSAVVVLPPEAQQVLPPSSREFQFYSKKENKLILLVDAWALDELKVPVYPEDRTHFVLAQQLRRYNHTAGCTGLRLFVKKRFEKETEAVYFSF